MDQSMDIDDEDIHMHCYNCFVLAKCTAKSNPSFKCFIIQCELECGAKFHACKKKEHLLLCPNVKVPCINAENGCSLFMLRKRQSRHLYSCPASVIHCTSEWNRCPIHVKKSSMQQYNGNFKEMQQNGHLDVALALRDKRMLQHWCSEAQDGHTPSCTKFRINPTTCLWFYRPKAPENASIEGSSQCSNLGSTTWGIATPGLKQSVCNELRNSYPTNIALNDVSNPLQSGKMSSEDNKMVNSLLNNEYTVDFDEPLQGNSDDKNCVEDSNFSLRNLDPTKYSLGDVLKLHVCEAMIVNENTPQMKSDEFMYDFNMTTGGILTRSTLNPQHGARISYFKFKNPSSTPPWFVPLGLDLNLESRTLLQTPHFMYSFLCSQEFRRDEYAWHYRNVHVEIHGGLNGWLQERCPLAQYGCQFTRKRFSPSPKSVIVYNENLDSFGVAPILSVQTNESAESQNRCSASEDCLQKTKSDRELTLTNLPFEVLRYISKFLDSFSLYNLSLTCSLLRIVSASHLENRGLVVLKWKRKKEDNQYKWKVACKSWHFSSNFAPIHEWDFDDSNNMSNHLQSCPFYERNYHRYPTVILESQSGNDLQTSKGLLRYKSSVSLDEKQNVARACN